MEPIPETWESIEEFGPFLMDTGLLQELRHMGSRVRGIVPECVGLSLAYNELGVTFTLVATDVVTAGLDGLQYLDDGPCVEAVEERRALEFSNEDVLDEDSWQLFSRGTAAAGIASTLTLPIMSGKVAIGSGNLYASSATAFSGKLDDVAEVLGGWAPGAIANADLSFATRRTAEEAPRILLDQARVEVAVGIRLRRRASLRPRRAPGCATRPPGRVSTRPRWLEWW
jgi:hypothetical protein